MLTTGSGSTDFYTPAVRSSSVQVVEAGGQFALPVVYHLLDVLLLLVIDRSEGPPLRSPAGWIRRKDWMSENGRVTIFSRRATGSESRPKNTLPTPVEVLAVAVQHSSGWSGVETAEGECPPTAVAVDGVLIGVRFGPDGLSHSSKTVPFGLHTSPVQMAGPTSALTISL